MKNHPTPNRRAFAALIPASLLLAAPAFAQDVPAATTAPPPAQVAPPPVVPTVSDTPVATPPAAAPATVTPPSAEPAATEAPAARTATRSTRAVTRTAHVTRTTAPVTARTPAPAAAAPAAPAPVAVTPAEPAPASVTPAPVEEAAPAPAAPAATTEATTTEQVVTWPWIVGGLLALLAGAGLFLMRRRRTEVDETIYDEPVYEQPYVEPVIQRAPIAAPAPVVAKPALAPAAAPEFLRTAPLAAATDVPLAVASEDAALAEPEAAEVAELTAGHAPIADRPWLEFALRPVRAGISADEALVEIELTVGNAGSVKAEDVRISTFLFANEPGSEAEMERMLIERGEGHDDAVHPITIEPGGGARVDATLALPKAQLLETTNGSILPVVIADARYTLADGREGRTSASFTIGVSEEGTPAMSPLSLSDRGMHDEVEARLYGVPEHA